MGGGVKMEHRDLKCTFSGRWRFENVENETEIHSFASKKLKLICFFQEVEKWCMLAYLVLNIFHAGKFNIVKSGTTFWNKYST